MAEYVKVWKQVLGKWKYVREPLETGGGGGSLPAFITTDDTPGAESIDIAGTGRFAPPATSGYGLAVVMPTGNTDAAAIFRNYVGVFSQDLAVLSAAAGFGFTHYLQGASAADDILYVADNVSNPVVRVGPAGEIFLLNLPTSDPTVAGQLWNDAGTLKVSAG